jgi:hypothetical protein
VLGKAVHELLPTVADIYKAPAIRTPSDAPLTKAATEDAQQIISNVLTDDRARSSKKSRSAPRPRK